MASKVFEILVRMNGSEMQIDPMNMDIDFGGERELVWRLVEESEGAGKHEFHTESIHFETMHPIRIDKVTKTEIRAVVFNQNEMGQAAAYTYRLCVCVPKYNVDVCYPSHCMTIMSLKPTITNLPR
ncbi:MAG TPA: hypothetical protein VFN09_08935 [Rhodanobacteraceae bacterium]|nr:hypothetical protein [Rhodanobacteraceae bacterium]